MKWFENIDKRIFIPSLLILVIIIIPLFVWPENSNFIIHAIFSFCTKKFGFLYIMTCLMSFGFLIWLTASPYANIRLGAPDEKPLYSNFSWMSMLFTAGVGTSIIILGFLEPIYYVSEPPFYLEPFSRTAYEYAHMYGQFHWGLSAWAFYNPAIIAVAYTIFVKKGTKLSLSSACEGAIGKHANGILGNLIDIFVVFGVVGSIATSLGLGTPILSVIIRDVFSISEQYDSIVRIIILLVWICIFGTSVSLGLDKGIRNLSIINILLAVIFMGIILFASPVGNIFKMEINSLGLYAKDFIRLNTWMDPFGDTPFIEDWTIFYWGWWIAFMPMMGMFVARISKGRTIKNVIWGQLIYGSAGCALSFMVFGGYSLYLQKEGIVDIAAILNSQGQSQAMLAILRTLPMVKLVMIFMCVVCFIYLATTIDSCAYVLASVTTKVLHNDEEPAKWNRILWAFIFCVLSIGLLLIGGLKAVQTISILAGLPLIGVSVLLVVSTVKMLKQHKDEDSK